eukprot:Em0008g112a
MFHKITIQKSKSPLSGHGLHLSLKPPWNTADLVTCFNIVYGLFDLPFDNFFQTATNYRSTRGHSMKLQSVVVKLDHLIPSFFLTNLCWLIKHAQQRDILVESFHLAHIHVQVEAGSGLSHDHSHSRPADWDHGKPAALELSVISLLNANILNEVGMAAGAVAQAAETQKRMANDQMCTELGWSCVPLAVESYDAWGKEAQEFFALLASQLAVHTSSSKSKTTFDLYSLLNLTLNRSIARAIISESFILADFVA